MNLIDKYGYCLVPKGTILLRSGNSFEFTDCMFFGLDELVGGCIGRENIQVWEVLQDLKVLFMVSHITNRAWVISSLLEIYNSKFPNEKEIDHLEIKQRDLNKRQKFITTLQEQAILGWLSSLEDNPMLEVCLFPDKSQFSSLICPLRSVSIEDYKFHSSLNKIKIYPSEQFYNRTKSQAGTFNEYYNSFVSRWTDEDPQQREFWKSINLRMKLRV